MCVVPVPRSHYRYAFTQVLPFACRSYAAVAECPCPRPVCVLVCVPDAATKLLCVGGVAACVRHAGDCDLGWIIGGSSGGGLARHTVGVDRSIYRSVAGVYDMHMAAGAPPGRLTARVFVASFASRVFSVTPGPSVLGAARLIVAVIYLSFMRVLRLRRASMFFRRSLWSLKARHNPASPAHNTTRTTETVRYAVKAQRHHPPGSTVALCHASLWSGSFTPLSVLRLHGLLQISDGGHHRPCGRAQLARDLLKVVSV